MYRRAAVILLASAMMCTPVCLAQETGTGLQSAEEGGQTEPPAPQTEPPAPQTEPPAPQTEPPAPQTEPPAPQTEPPAPQTEAPQTETTAPQTETAVPQSETAAPETVNHSTAIPENPEEKKLNQTIVDAGELDEGFSISVNGGESVVIEPDKNFRTVIDAITGGSYGYRMDYVRPGTGLREPIDVEPEGSIKTIFSKVYSMPGASCEIVLYINNGNSLWLNMRVSGSLENNDAAITFTSVADAKPCTVSYDANGGKLTDSISIVRRKGEWYSHFDMKASKDGAYFCGWYDGPGENADRVFPTDTVEKDITLYAHYSPYSTEVVAFDFGFSTPGDGGSLVHHLIFPKKEDGTYDITVYPVFEHDGRVIGGWLDGSGNPAELTGLSGSVTLRADWKDPAEIEALENAAKAQAETETEAETEIETETEAETQTETEEG